MEGHNLLQAGIKVGLDQSDRTGPDRIGSTRIASPGRINSDRLGLD